MRLPLSAPAAAAAAAALLLLPLPAGAADILYEPPAGGSTYSGPVGGGGDLLWNGLHVGGQLGGAVSGTDLDTAVRSQSSAFTGGSGGIETLDDEAGVTYGAHLGADLRFGNVVVGAATDYGHVGVSADSQTRFGANAVAVEREVTHGGSTRARLGFASGALLVYGTAGLAYGQIETEATLTDPAGLVAARTQTRKDYEFGTVLGGGADYMVTDTLSVGAEYTYTDLGDSGARRTFDERTGGRFQVDDSGNDIDFHRVQAKVSLHFF